MGRVTASGIPGQNQTFAYDMLGRLTSAVSPVGGVNKTVAYQWDLAGRNTRITYPTEGGVSLYVAYDYLVTGEMTELRENSTSVGVNVLAKYSYDNLGRRTALARAGGTAMTSSYSYFANDTRLQTLAHNLAGTANDLSLGFAWTPASQINGRTSSNDAYSWTAHVNEDFLATLNGLNQVTAFGAAAIAYDNRGNLIGDGTNNFVYDPQNRLTSATAAGSTATLKYDALGRLHEVAKPGFTTTRFLYDGAEAIAEYNSSGVLLRRYVRGAGPDELVVWYEGTALTDKRYVLTDERGSIIGAANAQGASLFKNAYDEYGRPAAMNTGRFQYTGQMWIGEIGLYHYKARLYSPNLGRFLQTDPIGYADGLNLYAYVGGDPVNATDPTGLEVDEIVVTGTRVRGGLDLNELRRVFGTDCGVSDLVPCSSNSLFEPNNEMRFATAGFSFEDQCSVGGFLFAGASGGAAGTIVGAQAGAAGGTFVVPLVGTISGGVGGAALGAVGGTAFGLGANGVACGASAVGAAIVHANSLRSQRPTYVYEVYLVATGATLKYGITSNPINRRYGLNFFSVFGAQIRQIGLFPDRASARTEELGLCAAYVAANGHLPPLSVVC